MSLFILSIIIWIGNDAFLNKVIPEEVVGYFLFFSMGLFIGIQCCIDALRRLPKDMQNSHAN